jgi:hypothetical protein
MRTIEVIARLARQRGIPLAELDRYLGYSYTVSDDQADAVRDHLPGSRG